MRIELPYGKDGKVSAEIQSENLIGIVEAEEIPGLAEVGAKIREAMLNPTASKRLSEMIEPGDKVVLIVTDISRPCPDEKLVPVILEELHNADVPDDQLTILVATGMHRPMTDEEVMEKLSKDVYERIEVINHVCTDKENLMFLGKDSKPWSSVVV